MDDNKNDCTFTKDLDLFYQYNYNVEILKTQGQTIHDVSKSLFAQFPVNNVLYT